MKVVKRLLNRSLPLLLAVAAVVVGFVFQDAGAAPLPTVTSTRAGTSCIIATSTDVTTANALGSGVTVKLKCLWSVRDNARAGTLYDHEFRPFASGCGTSSSSVCTNVTPSALRFQQYSGTAGSTNQDLLHGAASGGRDCTVADFTRTASGAGWGEFSWRCSATANWFGNNNPTLSNATIIELGSPSYTLSIAGMGLGGSWTIGAGTAAPGTSWAGSVDQVAWSVFGTSYPQYSFNATVGPTAFCGALVETDLPLTTSLSAGLEIEFSTQWTSGRTQSVDVMFPGTSTWRAVFVSGAIGNPSVSTLAVSSPVAYLDRYNVTVGDIKLRCYDTALAVFQYLDLYTPTDDPGDGRPRPCDTARVYWPINEHLSIGDGVDWLVNYSGLIDAEAYEAGNFTTISVEFATWDSETENTPGPFADLSWTPFTGGEDLPLGTSVTLSEDAVFDAPVTQFVLRCVDYLGARYGAQWTSGIRLNVLPPEDPNAAFNECMAGNGVGLNPSSWVPGLVRMGSCALQVLFVPSDSAVQELYGDGAEISDKAPVAYVVDGVALLYDVVDGAPEAVVAHEDDCFDVMADYIVVNGEPIDVSVEGEGCGGVLDATSVVDFREIEGYISWVGFVFTIVMASRRIIAGS